MVFSAYAVDIFRVSEYGGGHQIWFEAENFDERNPDTDEFFPVVDKDDAFGQAINRAGGAGGMLRYTFDISIAGGTGGDWSFRGRMRNSGNPSEWMLVAGDPDDDTDDLPADPPFPGGEPDGPLFAMADDRIFEVETAVWAWMPIDIKEGHTKELQDGLNTMYILHRQGDGTVFWDVFVWSDDSTYHPTDEDYLGAEEKEDKGDAVQPGDKLSTTWAAIKAF